MDLFWQVVICFIHVSCTHRYDMRKLLMQAMHFSYAGHALFSRRSRTVLMHAYDISLHAVSHLELRLLPPWRVLSLAGRSVRVARVPCPRENGFVADRHYMMLARPNMACTVRLNPRAVGAGLVRTPTRRLAYVCRSTSTTAKPGEPHNATSTHERCMLIDERQRIACTCMLST